MTSEESARRTARRGRGAFAVLVLVTVLALVTMVVSQYAAESARVGRQGPLTDPTDLVAFYCGGAALDAGRDPYRAEPLRTCERRALAASRIAIMPYLVVPAPLPPYALAAFAALALLPFGAACVTFFVISVAASGASIVLARRLAPISPILISAALVVALAIGSLYLGQIVPLVLVALCGCAVALRAGRFGIAACCALATTVEPHVGLGAVLALFFFEPRTRPALGLGALFLGAVSLVAGGTALNYEYVVRVLPAHARSEVANFAGQFSLTAAAFALGADSRTSLLLGEASYVAMLALGLELGRRLARAFSDPAFLVLAPSAAVLVGGVFLHDHQLALALPFAFLLARYVTLRPLAYAAIAVLAIPPESAITIAHGPFLSHLRFAPVPVLAAADDGSQLAERIWQTWIGLLAAREGRTPFEIFACKLPAWAALCTLGLLAGHALRRRAPKHATVRLAIAGRFDR